MSVVKMISELTNSVICDNTLERDFDRMPRNVLWLALQKVRIPEWIVRLVQVKHQNAKSWERVNNSFSDVVSVQFGVHQGSVLSPLLFIIVLEALSQEFYTDQLWKPLPDTPNELLPKFGNWKKTFRGRRSKYEYG